MPRTKFGIIFSCALKKWEQELSNFYAKKIFMLEKSFQTANEKAFFSFFSFTFCSKKKKKKKKGREEWSDF